MSIIKNSYGKWLQIMLMLDTDNAETHSVSESSHLDALWHRNRLLLEHIQDNEDNPYTKITEIEHSAQTSQLDNDSTARYINFLVSPESTLFLMKMEIRPTMHMAVLTEDAFNDKILNSFHINTHSHKNYLWVGPDNSDELFGFP